MLALYRFPGATCAAKVLIALEEKSVPFEDRLLTRENLREPWYRQLNPNGVVPTIIHQGETIIESSVILHYIQDAFEGPSLSPSVPLARARMLYWMKFLDDALHSLMIMTYAIYQHEDHVRKTEDEREAYYSTVPNLRERAIRRSVLERGLDAPEVLDAMQLMMSMQRRVNELAREHKYLTGDYSLADISITPFISRLNDLTLLAPKGLLPHLHRWWNDIRSRPSFERGITASMPRENSVRLLEAAHRQSDRISALMATA